MSTTSPINGLPVPDDDSPNAPPIHFQALVDVLDSRLIAAVDSTADRDSKIPAPRNSMIVYSEADDQFYARIKGAWVVTGIGSVRYYAAGAGGAVDVLTAPAVPTGGASLSLPAGTYDVDVRAHFVLSVSSDEREINLHLYSGGSGLFTTSFTVNDVGKAATRSHSDFTRVTLGAAGTLTVRTSASAVGGTQKVSSNAIRAIRVAP